MSSQFTGFATLLILGGSCGYFLGNRNCRRRYTYTPPRNPITQLELDEQDTTRFHKQLLELDDKHGFKSDNTT